VPDATPRKLAAGRYLTNCIWQAKGEKSGLKLCSEGAMLNQIAILEDNAERRREMLAQLQRHLPDAKIVFCTSATEMLNHLRQNLANIRVIALDHDLEKQSPDDPDPGTGRDVSDFLCQQAPCCAVIVHTTNVPASYRMQRDLEEASWRVTRVVPYGDTEWIGREWLSTVCEAWR